MVVVGVDEFTWASASVGSVGDGLADWAISD